MIYYTLHCAYFQLVEPHINPFKVRLAGSVERR